MNTLATRLLALLAALLLPYPTLRAADEFDSLYYRYLQLYASHGKDDQFYATSKELKKYYTDHDDLDSYFKIQMNEALYATDHHQPGRAYHTANEMMLEMKKKHYDAYNMVYVALGTVFESLGNYSMAEHYYTEGISNTRPDDVMTLMGAYSHMAYLLKFVDPDRSRQWNARYEQMSHQVPYYRQVYLFIEALTAFAKNEASAFGQRAQAYYAYRNAHADLDNYGLSTMKFMEQAMAGNYEQALAMVDGASDDLNELSRLDARIIILRMQQRAEDALEVSIRRAWTVDSLNSDMLFSNINELSTQVGLAKLKSDSASQRERLLTAVLVLAVLLIVLLAFAFYRHRASRQDLRQKNEQLRTALSMAEESDKMKTEFVRSVSHEMRTPLNAISGFAEVVSNPDMHLSAEDRQDFMNRINDNIKSLTTIVDEMLQMAEQGSSEFYPHTGSVYCNKFLSEILYSYRDKASADVELSYTTKVINRFAINTNKEGLRRIINHLVSNAVKFTTKGFIELNCRQSDDLQKVIITITDTGRGVPKEEQEKVFEQFYKVDSFKQGIGLGLTVSKKVAKKLGGDLVLDPDYSGGARFVLTLPFE